MKIRFELNTAIRYLTDRPLIIAAFFGFTSFVVTWSAANSWQYSFIGDEWGFFTWARNIVTSNPKPAIFNLSGLYGTNPVLSSYWQALFLKLFGVNNAAWRLSNAILLIPINIFFFLLVRMLFNKRAGLTSTLFLSASSFIFGYFRFGYPNPVSLLFFIVVLYTLAQTYLLKSYKWGVLCGVSLGTGFYFVFGSLIPFIILFPIFYTLIREIVVNKKILKLVSLYAVIYVTSLVCILPSLNYLQGYLRALRSHSFVKPEYNDHSQIFTNTAKTFQLFFKNYDYFNNHFIYGPYFDLISQVFILIGILYIFYSLFRNRGVWTFGILFLLCCYIGTVLVLSVTNPYKYIPVTRGHLLIPFGAVMAGIGLYGVLDLLKVFSVNFRRVFFAFTYFLLLALNIYIADFYVLKMVGVSWYAGLVKVMEEHDHVTVLTSDVSHINKVNISEMRLAYSIKSDLQFKDYDSFACSADPLSTTFVLIKSERTGEITDRLKNCGIKKYLMLSNYGN